MAPCWSSRLFSGPLPSCCHVNEVTGICLWVGCMATVRRMSTPRANPPPSSALVRNSLVVPRLGKKTGRCNRWGNSQFSRGSKLTFAHIPASVEFRQGQITPQFSTPPARKRRRLLWCFPKASVSGPPVGADAISPRFGVGGRSFHQLLVFWEIPRIWAG